MIYPRIKRNRYVDESGFAGVHTGKNHAEDMQDFHLPLAQAQNAGLFMWGIVRGLEVSGTLGTGTEVTIQPGTALDVQGRLVVLAEDGFGDIGIDPAGEQHNQVATPVALGFGANTGTVYVTIQYAEILRSDEGVGGRLEQVPWLRLQPVAGFVEDGTALILAVVEIDNAGHLAGLSATLNTAPARRFIGQSMQALELRRAAVSDAGVVGATTTALRIAAHDSGLRITVPGAGDRVEFLSEDGSGFSEFAVGAKQLTVQGDLQVQGATNFDSNVGISGAFRLQNGVAINEVSADGTLADSSQSAVPTESAVREYIDNLLIGSIAAFATDTPPAGWLECNGFAFPREGIYANLFARINTRFGEGNGSTTFNVPDLRGQFIRGWDHGAGVDPDRGTRSRRIGGGATGDAVGSYQGDDYRSHNHAFVGSGAYTQNGLGWHTHNGDNRAYWQGSQPPNNLSWTRAMANYSWTINGAQFTWTPSWNWVVFNNDATVNSTNLAHSHYYQPAGWISGSGGSEVRPANVSLMFCIKY